ncbi:hypothetical protein JW777_09675 [bacterium]|nr:hypothetical protein [bacterium]
MKRKRLRRIIRIAILAVAGIAAALTLTVIAFWLFFPVGRILSFIESQSRTAGWPVEIQSLAWRTPGRLDFRGMRISVQTGPETEAVRFLELERLFVRFRIAPLLRRELSISEIRMENPDLALSDSFMTALRELAAKPSEPNQPPKPLPLGIGIRKLELRDFSLSAVIPGSPSPSGIDLEGLNLDIANLWVPPEAGQSVDNVHGNIRLFAKNARLAVDAAHGRFLFRPEADMRFRWAGKGRWTFGGKAELLAAGADSGRVAGVFFRIKGKGIAEEILLDSCDVTAVSRILVQAKGLFSMPDSVPSIDFTLKGSPFPVESLKPVLLRYLPDTLSGVLRPINIRGTLDMGIGSVKGAFDDLRFNFAPGIRGLTMSSPLPQLKLENAEASLRFSGTASTEGMRRAEASGSLRIPLFRYTINDSVSVTAEESGLDLMAILNEKGLPTAGTLSGSVQKLFGGSVNLEATWAAKGFGDKAPDSLSVLGSVRLAGADLSLLPAAPAGLSGPLDAGVDVKPAAGRRFHVSLAASAPAIHYPYGGKTETLKPVRLDADMVWRPEQSFQKWVLEKTDFRALDCITAELSGEIDHSQAGFSFTLKDAMIRNAALPGFLPDTLAEILEGMEAFGMERLDASVRSAPGDGPNAVEITGSLSVENAGVVLPLQFMRFSGLDGLVDFSGNAGRLEGTGSLTAADLTFSRMRPEPITGTTAAFGFSFDAPDRVSVRDFSLSVPDLAFQVKAAVDATLDGAFPGLKGRADFVFSSSDSVRITPRLLLIGNASGGAAVVTEGVNPRFLKIDGELLSDSMAVFSPPLVEVRGIRGRIPFTFEGDPLKGRLAVTARKTVFPPMAYETDRGLFMRLFPGLSEMTVRSVSAADTRIEHIRLDVSVEQGMIQVPRFSARLLGGNLAGSLRLDLNDGKPESMTYAINATAARINSAVLLGTGASGEKSELDACLDFTGRGLNPDSLSNAVGALAITRIGPQFTDRLLQGLDPQGTEGSIRMTRRLLSLWYKPRLFSFELRHGFVYPALFIEKPWFVPVKMTDKITYGRLSVDFFMQNMAVFMEK